MTSLRTVAAARASLLLVLMSSALSIGCGSEPAPKPDDPVVTKPTEPTVPAEIQSAAEALLGADSKVLVANVVPKTPKDSIPGTIVTRAVVAENDDGKWQELFRCDEHLKNAKGYLGMTPIEPVAGWRLQFEQDVVTGLTLYLTPVKGMEDAHVLPIGIRWNPKTKRYQSLDRSYEQFLSESPSLSNARSQLR